MLLKEIKESGTNGTCLLIVHLGKHDFNQAASFTELHLSAAVYFFRVQSVSFSVKVLRGFL